MIFLWVDDTRPLPSHYTDWAKTAQEAIAILKTGKVVQISLDHDLGSGQMTGYDVAKFIEEEAIKGTLKPIRFRVHTHSVEGRKNICAALINAHDAWKRGDFVLRT